MMRRRDREEKPMARYSGLTPEERAIITQIQDLLLDRYVELKQALEKGENARAQEIEAAIIELQREKDKIGEWASH
jgi:DNA replication initiation complex subunit (GINS family)